MLDAANSEPLCSKDCIEEIPWEVRGSSVVVWNLDILEVPPTCKMFLLLKFHRELLIMWPDLVEKPRLYANLTDLSSAMHVFFLVRHNVCLLSFLIFSALFTRPVHVFRDKL